MMEGWDKGRGWGAEIWGKQMQYWGGGSVESGVDFVRVKENV